MWGPCSCLACHASKFVKREHIKQQQATSCLATSVLLIVRTRSLVQVLSPNSCGYTSEIVKIHQGFNQGQLQRVLLHS